MDRLTKAIKTAKNDQPISDLGSAIEHDPNTGFGQTIPVSTEHLLVNKVVACNLSNPISEIYRLLRTRILKIMDQNGWKTLGISGPTPSSGKSLTATNLAIAIAMKPGNSALLIDADLRKAGTTELLGIEYRYGLEDFLSSSASMEKVVINPGIDKLGVMINNRPINGSSDLLMSQKMGALIHYIKSKKDNLVGIFDMPPVLVADDAVALSSLLDAVLLVVDSTQTNKRDLEKSLELMKDQNIIGCVLNKAEGVDTTLSSYGYGEY